MIILISGYKRHGKDTAANAICDYFGFKKYSFAQPIKEACSLLFGWSLNHIESFKEDVDPYWKISPRQALQWLGTDSFQYDLPNHFPEFNKHIGRSFWVKKFEQLYEDTRYDYVISDYRFPHEYELLKHHNPICIRIQNDKIKNNDAHESESHISSLFVHDIIYNNGSKHELEDIIKLKIPQLIESIS